MKIIFFIILIIILNYLYYRYKHRFWSIQPVSNWYCIYFKDTIISDTYPKTYPVPSKYLLSDIKKNDFIGLRDVYNFIDKHYHNSIVDSHINFEYFLWSLKFPFLYDPIILCLKERKKIIGSICSKCFKLSINNNQIITSYVDYLCINSLFRKNNLAPILISKMVEKGFKFSKCFIFKKEENPLPFRYITTYNDYYLDVKKIKKNIINNNFKFIKILEDKDLEKVYNFYNYHCKNNYSLYRIFTISEFKYYFVKNNLNKFCKIYFYKVNNEINGLIAFYPFSLKNDRSKLYYQIQFVLANNNNIMSDLFEYFIYHISSDTNIVVISNTGYNDYLIKKYNFKKDMCTNIHMYNYHVIKTISSKKICLSFV